jgi:hypothetical protein
MLTLSMSAFRGKADIRDGTALAWIAPPGGAIASGAAAKLGMAWCGEAPQRRTTGRVD